MAKLLSWLSRWVALSFRFYPTSYRKTFEAEMRSVYHQAARDAEGSGAFAWMRFITRELGGIIPAVLREYWLAFREGGRQMKLVEGISDDRPRGETPPVGKPNLATLLAGSAIFLVWGLDAVVTEIAFSSSTPWFGALIMVSHLLSWILFLLPPAVVGYASTRNFPRWTYASVGSALLYSYLLAVNAIATPQVTLFGTMPAGTVHMGWRAWIPLILALGVALLVNRSLRPFGCFFSNAWDDWTLLSYAMLGWLPVLLIAGFDEMPSGITLIFLPLAVTILLATAIIYMASQSITRCGWVLFGGAFLSLGITLVSTEIYWSGVGAFNAPRVTLIMIVALGILFSPILIGVIRNVSRRGMENMA